jgi:hypothetical protein
MSGDYDALTSILCMVDATGICCCIKCNIAGVRYASVNTSVLAQNRRYLSLDHHDRKNPQYGASELWDFRRAKYANMHPERQFSVTGTQAQKLKEAAERKEYGAQAT